MHNTNKVMESLAAAFESYEDMQQKHLVMARSALELLEQGKFNITDLTGIDYERQRSFNLLKESIEAIRQLTLDENYAEMFKLYSQRLSEIIEMEGLLQQSMQELKNKLEERLHVLKTGGKGLAGYRKSTKNEYLKYLDQSL